jgi:hypothetical protein
LGSRKIGRSPDELIRVKAGKKSHKSGDCACDRRLPVQRVLAVLAQFFHGKIEKLTVLL